VKGEKKSCRSERRRSGGWVDDGGSEIYYGEVDGWTVQGQSEFYWHVRQPSRPFGTAALSLSRTKQAIPLRTLQDSQTVRLDW
jgi:hypothetical protein